MSDEPRYDIEVSVRTEYLAVQSNPAEDHYVFAYYITVRNTGSVTVQLVSRHWIITDGNGSVEEVRGLGVVGHQPLLQPGQSFEYTSGCALHTPMGTMKGSYQFVAEGGRKFDASIAEFVLSMPRVLH